MKKYFMQGTDDELKFGDVISVVLTKENPDGTTKHICMECKFLEEYIPLLLEDEIIEVREDPEEYSYIPEDITLEDIYNDYASLKEKVEELEKYIPELDKLFAFVDPVEKKHGKAARK